MWLHVLVLIFCIHRIGPTSLEFWLTALDTTICNTTTVVSPHIYGPMNLAAGLQLCMAEPSHCDGLFWDFTAAEYHAFDLTGAIQCYGKFYAGNSQALSEQGQPKLWIKRSLIQSQGHEYFIALPNAGAAHGLTNRAAPIMGIPQITVLLDAFVPYQNGVLGCHLQDGYCHFLDLSLKTWTAFESFSPGSHLKGRLAQIYGHPIVIGGYSSISSSLPLKLTDSVQIYDPKDQTWKDAPRMIKARGMFTCHNLDFESIIVIGGYIDDSPGQTDQVERWTFGQSFWVALNPLPQAIGPHQSVVTGWPDGRKGILILGGRGGSPDPSALKNWAFFLDFQSMSWEDAPSQYLPEAMDFGELYYLRNMLYSIPMFQPTDDGSSSPGTVILTKDMSVFNSTWVESDVDIPAGTQNIFILGAQQVIITQN
ncbi:uncharacterized protein LOC131891766 isoform X2 [Tigriopus californicus]|uniref:uncharacterized protein LOC131891766 isoform X2 n=1 Tax=Tigriopus californicus TaxID=6832 RepID=UPI0027DA0420|nr:uncharacterized protein LOC131891766 isoform X2 [Tigriopus californicus]